MDTVSILLLRAVAKYLALLRFGFDVFVVHFISARSCSVSVAFFYLCCDFTQRSLQNNVPMQVTIACSAPHGAGMEKGKGLERPDGAIKVPGALPSMVSTMTSS